MLRNEASIIEAADHRLHMNSDRFFAIATHDRIEKSVISPSEAADLKTQDGKGVMYQHKVKITPSVLTSDLSRYFCKHF